MKTMCIQFSGRHVEGREHILYMAKYGDIENKSVDIFKKRQFYSVT
jgi:hypothetical protein